MRTISRRTVRGAATMLGALAIVVGTAGCGSLLDGWGGGDDSGADDQEQGQEPPAEDDAPAGDTSDDSDDSDDTDDADDTDDNADQATDDAEDPDDSADDSHGSAGGSTEEDSTDDSAGAADEDSDDDGADPAEPLSDADLEAATSRFVDFWEAFATGDGETACRLVVDHDTGKPAEVKGLQTCVDSFEELMQDEEFDPSTIAAFDRSMFSAVDNGDGRAEITILGESTEILMVKAEDGKWCIDGDAPF